MDLKQSSTAERDDPALHYETLQQLGDCYTSVDDYAQAKECYEKAATIAPDEPAPYVGLGIVALQKELLDDAEIAFRVARRLDTDCAKAYGGLAMVAHKKTNYEIAFEMYLKCLQLDPDHLTALLGLFQVSCQMGSFSRVIYYLEIYLDSHKGDTSVMFCLAALYTKDDKFEQSKKMLSGIMALEPDNEDAACLLEEVEHNLARKKQAGN